MVIFLWDFFSESYHAYPKSVFYVIDSFLLSSLYSWSYGVLLWEIVTLAASPYPGIYAKEVVDFIKNGNRMQKPNHCSDDL